MNDWQPIETAPKDGTEIIGWFPQFKYPVKFTHWIDRQTVEHGKVVSTTAEWFVMNMRFGFTEDEKTPQPTHWMPLPPSPTEADK